MSEDLTAALTEAKARCWQYDEDNERIFARHVFELQAPIPNSPAACIHCAKTPDADTPDASLAWRQPLGILRSEAKIELLIRKGFYHAMNGIPSDSTMLRDHKSYAALVRALYLGLEYAAPGEMKTDRVYAGTLLTLDTLKKEINTPHNDIYLYVNDLKGNIVDNQNLQAGLKMRKVHFKKLTGYLLETSFINLFFTHREKACGFLHRFGWMVNFEGRWLSYERSTENAFLHLLEKELSEKENKLKLLESRLKSFKAEY